MNPGTVAKVVKVVYDVGKNISDNKKKDEAAAKKEGESVLEKALAQSGDSLEKLDEKVEESRKKNMDDEDFTEEDYQKMLEEDMDEMKKRGEV